MPVDFNEMAGYYDAMYVDPAGYENECDRIVERLDADRFRMGAFVSGKPF